MSGEKYQKMSERLLHYKYLSQPIVQWKKYYKELDHIKRIESKLTDKNKEIKILKEKYKKLRESDKDFLKSKEKSIQHYLQLIHDLRSQLKKEDKVNGLLKIQNKNLNKKIYELQILHNKNSQTKDDTTITNVVDQPNLFNREKTQKQRTKKSWFSC